MMMMKMRVLFSVFLIVCLLALSADAKKKRKFEGDFEFAEEEETKTTTKKGDKKTWILDPTSDLCQALNCKKREMCLLEDAFTAVCVSKKELHKNGDIIIHKSKLKASKTVDESDAARDDEEDDTDDDDDDLYYEDDDDAEDNSDAVTSCTPCPVVKPTFLCGTDNRTYSSMCRLDYHNCIHHSEVKISCKGFCPCKDVNIRLKKKEKELRGSVYNQYNKYKPTKENKTKQKDDKYKLTPEDIKFKNKHYKYLKYTKYNKHSKLAFPEDNEVLSNKVSPNNYAWKKECTPTALESMGNRLLDWFSVVMAEAKKDKTKRRSRKPGVHFPPYCKREVQWMFQHLNVDEDTQLSLQELYDLEHDQNEKCIKPFLDRCDADRDIFVSPDEWCKCFDKSDRPCAAVKRRIGSGLLGAYVPDCDNDGYYKSTQCHSSVGMCWCVDKHGVEYANTRTRGKPNCESIIGKAENNFDDDDDNDIEGSADQPLEF